jgi:hypothetical protein
MDSYKNYDRKKLQEQIFEVLKAHGVERFGFRWDGPAQGVLTIKDAPSEKLMGDVWEILPKHVNIAWQSMPFHPQNEIVQGGTKHDAEKTRLDLLSSSWLESVGKVLTFGARKYDSHNWRKGIARSRLVGAALRHLLAYNGGEDNDPETGLSHLAHASCCLMFASEMHDTRPDLDDRYKKAATP